MTRHRVSILLGIALYLGLPGAARCQLRVIGVDLALVDEIADEIVVLRNDPAGPEPGEARQR